MRPSIDHCEQTDEGVDRPRPRPFGRSRRAALPLPRRGPPRLSMPLGIAGRRPIANLPTTSGPTSGRRCARSASWRDTATRSLASLPRGWRTRRARTSGAGGRLRPVRGRSWGWGGGIGLRYLRAEMKPYPSKGGPESRWEAPSDRGLVPPNCALLGSLIPPKRKSHGYARADDLYAM